MPEAGDHHRGVTIDSLGGSVADRDWRRPSRQLINLRIVQLVAAGLVAVVIVAAISFPAGGPAAGGIALGVVVVVTVLLAFTLRRRVQAWGYAERDEDLVVTRGVLFRRLSVIPYGRMQFVDVTAGPFERSFKLATVRMHTAAAASDARIPGLTADEAARLRDRLTTLGEAKAAGL